MPESSSPMTTAQVISLSGARELRQRLAAKSFYLLTGLLVVIIIALGFVGRLTGSDDPATTDVAVVADVPAEVSDAFVAGATALGRPVELVVEPDLEAATDTLRDGDVSAVIADGSVTFRSDVDEEVLLVAQQAAAAAQLSTALEAAGLTAAEVEEAMQTEPLDVVVIEGDDSTSGLAVLAGTLAAVLLFICLQTFGTYVLMGVVEEKSTAVVEILLVRAQPDQLLAGKVIGIGIAALIQFGAAVVAGLVALAISGVDVPGEIWSAVPMTLVWFLGGYALYSTLFALAGSLVSRQEDAQAASAPILTVLIGSYILIFFLGYAPDSTASIVLSLLPPVSPLLMPMRMAAGAATPLELGAALLLLVAAIYGTWKLAGKIYEQVLLRRGTRISWKDALSLARRSHPT